MTAGQLTLSATGAFLSVLMMFYSVKVLHNFRKHGDITIALLFPHGRAETGLKILLASFLIYAAGMAAGAAGLFYHVHILDTVSKLSSGLGLLGIAYFIYSMADITAEG